MSIEALLSRSISNKENGSVKLLAGSRQVTFRFENWSRQ